MTKNHEHFTKLIREIKEMQKAWKEKMQQKLKQKSGQKI